MEDTIEVIVASEKHLSYVETILDTIEKAAKVRGTGIAKRSPEYVKQKMLEGKAIIALDGDKFAGFCYIESWRTKTASAVWFLTVRRVCFLSRRTTGRI